MSPEMTLKSVMEQDETFYRFTFFCELCDHSHTTGRIRAESVAEARGIAAREARLLFNRCHACGRWVCDAHYNEDIMQCVICVPKRLLPESKTSHK